MANWIKIMTGLPRSAKIMRLAAVLKCDRLKALGAAVDWFCWLDEQCTDGCTGLTPRQVDEMLGVRKLCDALVTVGWAEVHEDCIVHAVDFEQHNGEGAKGRAVTAERVAKYRNSNAKCNAGGVTDSLQAALPRKRDVYNNKGDDKATLHRERGERYRATGEQPSLMEVDEGYGAWLCRVCSALSQLARMRTVPRDVDAAGRVMYLTGYTPTDAELEALRRFWEAPADKLHGVHRPPAFRWVFESLPDVCRNALEWCKVDDREQRKAAATARRKAKEREQEAPRTPMTEEARKEFFEGLRGFSGREGGEA